MQYPSIDHLKVGQVSHFLDCEKERIEDSSKDDGEKSRQMIHVDGESPGKDNFKWYLEEKLDGSQLSVSYERSLDGWNFYNKKKKLGTASNFFSRSIEMLSKITEKFNRKLVYHGEAIGKTKHNVIQYSRVPRHYWICYDIYQVDEQRYLSPEEKKVECHRIDVECVQLLYQNSDPTLNPYDVATIYLAGESMLGGRREGVVLKHHRLWNKKSYVATKRKLVNEEFKESHRQGSIKMKTDPVVFLQELGRAFSLPGRFQKAVQHLQEAGLFDDSPKQNLNRFRRELDSDFDKEYREEIKEYLWNELGHLIKEFAKEGSEEWFKLNTIESNHTD